jgi:hypothetical protein
LGIYKKIAFGILGLLIILFVAAASIAPRVINSASVKEKIITTASQQLDGDVTFQKITVSLFPRPHADINEGTVAIPGKAEGKVSSLTVYPRILPLLWGNLQIAKISVLSPNITANLPEKKPEKAGQPAALSLVDIQENAILLLASLSLDVPDLIVEIKEGKINLLENKAPVFLFHDVQARLSFPREGLKIEMSSGSNLWKKITLKGNLRSDEFKGEGFVKLSHFRPDILSDYLFADDDNTIGDSDINLELKMKADGIHNIRAEFQGSFPHITVYRGERTLLVNGKRFKGDFHMDGDTRTVSLDHLSLESPRLNLAGTLSIDKPASEFSLSLDGSDIDVLSTRKTALSFIDDVPVVQEIFQIIQGGTIPQISFESRGNSLVDLDATENIHIKGKLQGGNIFIPGIDLHLEDVKGDAVVSEGILKGENLEARLENSQGSNGTLKLGLKDADAPFHLDIMVKADLHQLPPLLNHIVNNEAFIREISKIKKMAGEVEGRLVLGESLKQVKAKIDVSKLSLKTDYERIPYPLHIEGGAFSYHENGISVADVKGSIQNSSFVGIHGKLDFGEEPTIEISSGSFNILLDEIYPWLLSYDQIDEALKKYSKVNGVLKIIDMSIRGPLLRPGIWEFHGSGVAENLLVETDYLPDSVSIKRGSFVASNKKLVLEEMNMHMLDADIHYSAIIHGYLDNRNKVTASMKGNMGTETVEWLSRALKLSEKIALQAPLSLTDAQLAWVKETETSFRGNLQFPDGPVVLLDMFKRPEELLIKELAIKDENSDVSTGIKLRENRLDISFSGKLTQKTMDKIITSEIIRYGWVKGDFSASIRLDKPVLSTARGNIEGEHLMPPLRTEVPFAVERFHVSSADDRTKIESAKLTWGDNHFILKGDVTAQEDEFIVDMDIAADGIQFENITKTFMKKDEKEEDLFEDLPVKGVFRLESQYFTFGDFTWTPFHADVSLEKDTIDINVNEAVVCGIATPGTVTIADKDIGFDIQLISREQPLEPTFSCLSDKKTFVTGTYDLEGNIISKGKSEDLSNSLSGELTFRANSGQVRKGVVLDRTFKFLNKTENLEQEFPDIDKEAFSYRFIEAKGTIDEGILRLNELIIDSPTTEIAGQGNVNIFDKELDLNLLVAPIKSVDSIVKKIPLLGSVTGGTIISFPVKVKGSFDDPKVSYLSATAIGSGLLRVMQGTLKAPIRIFEPFMKKNDEEEEEEE